MCIKSESFWLMGKILTRRTLDRHLYCHMYFSKRTVCFTSSWRRPPMRRLGLPHYKVALVCFRFLWASLTTISSRARNAEPSWTPASYAKHHARALSARGKLASRLSLHIVLLFYCFSLLESWVWLFSSKVLGRSSRPAHFHGWTWHEQN